MALTNIYLARHGETEYNKYDQIQGRGIDISLNETGIRQAQAIAGYLRDIELHGVFSSSLKRSRETAEIVANASNLAVKSYKELDEMNFGEFEGQPASEIESELEALHQKWRSGDVDYDSPNGESPTTVLDRAGNKMKAIIGEHQNKNLLFILHGRLIRIILSDWLRDGLTEMHRVPHSNGALYHIRWDGEQFDPVYINKTEHLEVIS